MKLWWGKALREGVDLPIAVAKANAHASPDSTPPLRYYPLQSNSFFRNSVEQWEGLKDLKTLKIEDLKG